MLTDNGSSWRQLQGIPNIVHRVQGKPCNKYTIKYKQISYQENLLQFVVDIFNLNKVFRFSFQIPILILTV
jgi:hypothetical protein